MKLLAMTFAFSLPCLLCFGVTPDERFRVEVIDKLAPDEAITKFALHGGFYCGKECARQPAFRKALSEYSRKPMADKATAIRWVTKVADLEAQDTWDNQERSGNLATPVDEQAIWMEAFRKGFQWTAESYIDVLIVSDDVESTGERRSENTRKSSSGGNEPAGSGINGEKTYSQMSPAERIRYMRSLDSSRMRSNPQTLSRPY